MTCQDCKADNVSPKENGMIVCWCGLDLCAGCVEAHLKGCEWALANKVKPEKKTKVKPLPKVGRSKHMRQRYQKEATA